jgi:membrane associated rhomboid family serine protease
MIIPWGTDAPVYHRPIATIGVIAAIVLVQLLVPWTVREEWTLVLGDGIHPIEWLTSLFVHAGSFDVAGNVLFLWTFGLVVEGKLGWWRFLLVYLGIGVTESALLQFVVHSDPPFHMLGSSGVIFGLLAMCLVWAPLNEVVCILWLRFTPSVFDVSILWFAAGYIVLDLVGASFTGAVMASVLDRSTGAILAAVFDHVAGAAIGFALATSLLALGWVDCENWDLFAILQGRRGQSAAEARKARSTSAFISSRYQKVRAAKAKGTSKRKMKGKTSEADVTSMEDASAAALRTMRRHLELGEVEAALAVHNRCKRVFAKWQPAESDWLALIQAVVGASAWNDAVAVMRDYMDRTAEPSPRVLLKLAQVLIQKQSRPQQGLRVLDKIAKNSLPASLESLRRKLVRSAEQLQDEMW